MVVAGAGSEQADLVRVGAGAVDGGGAAVGGPGPGDAGGAGNGAGDSPIVGGRIAGIDECVGFADVFGVVVANGGEGGLGAGQGNDEGAGAAVRVEVVQGVLIRVQPADRAGDFAGEDESPVAGNVKGGDGDGGVDGLPGVDGGLLADGGAGDGEVAAGIRELFPTGVVGFVVGAGVVAADVLALDEVAITGGAEVGGANANGGGVRAGCVGIWEEAGGGVDLPLGAHGVGPAVVQAGGIRVGAADAEGGAAGGLAGEAELGLADGTLQGGEAVLEPALADLLEAPALQAIEVLSNDWVAVVGAAGEPVEGSVALVARGGADGETFVQTDHGIVGDSGEVADDDVGADALLCERGSTTRCQSRREGDTISGTHETHDHSLNLNGSERGRIHTGENRRL